MPHVSICIPCYNASRFIGSTIESVLASAYSDFELIVSDDASTDDTVQAVARFTDPRIRVMRNETNLGAPKNWNRALASAAGDYVGLLNHDDTYGPFWLPFAVHVLDKYPHIGWVTTAYRIIDDADRTCSTVAFFPTTGESNPREALLYIARFGALGPTYLARREVIQELGCYTESAGPYADHDLYLRLTAKYPLYYSSHPHAAWRDHGDRLTYRIDIVRELTLALGILDRVFRVSAVPEELRDFEQFFYTCYYDHLLNSMEKAMDRGEPGTLHDLFGLAANGYKGHGESRPYTWNSD